MSITTQAPHLSGSGGDAGDFAQQLDTVVQLLQAANAMPDMADPGLLAEMVGMLQQGATGAYPGVPELLRSWRMGMLDLARAKGGFDDNDLVLATLWFASLQEHVAGRLDAEGRAMLAELPDGIRWLPRLSPAFAQGIARRLGAHAQTQTMSAAAVVETMATPHPADPQQAAPTDGRDASPTDTTADTTTDTIVEATVEPTPPSTAQVAAAPTVESTLWIAPALAEARSDASPAPDTTAVDAFAAATPEPTAQQFADDGSAFAALDSAVTALFGWDTAADTGTVAHTAADDGSSSAFAMDFVTTDEAPADIAADNATDAAAETQANVQADAQAETLLWAGEDAAVDDALTGTAEDDAPNAVTHDLASGFTAGTRDSAGFDGGAHETDTFETDTFEAGTLEADTLEADTLEADTFADGAFAAGDNSGPHETGTIWIGQEELDLTRQAIAEQLLPLAQAWSDSSDPEAAATLTGELGYHMHLVGNVLELIGTHALAYGMETVRACVEVGDDAVGPETVATWCSVLLAVIEAPGEESAELLAMAADGLPGLDAAWAEALRAEMARVAIGFDPALIAARKTVAESDDVQLIPAEDVLPSVMDGMLRELPGNAERLGAAVRALAEQRSFAPMDEARRVAHTIKGDANTVGVRGLANLTHALEDILVALVKRPEELDDALATLLVEASDCVEEMADHLLGRGPAPAGALAMYQQVLDAANSVSEGGSTATVRAAETAPASADAQATRETASDDAAPAAAAAAATPAPSGQSLNVASALLDELQRLAGEGMVTAHQIDQQIDGLATLHRDQRSGVRNTQELIARLDDLVALRGAALQSAAQQAGAEVDPLEMDQYNELHIISRQLLESQADSAEFMRRIGRTMALLDELRNQQEQLNRELQRTIQRTRTVPFGQVSARLQRIVRQTARQVGKAVELEIVGEQIPVDAELLERVVEPLAHLLRNAIDHGIEPLETRRAAGKPDAGNIRVQVGLQGDSATIEIRDDGGGLDYAAIRRRAEEAGLIEPGLFGSEEPLDERQLARLILLPGFSTREKATDVSGRGIGMDVVNQRVMALRGIMSIVSDTGKGMRVSLRLPLTQTLANVIIVRGQRQVSAIVASSVERVVSFAHDDIRLDAEQGLQAMVDGEWLPALPVETLYDDSADLSGWLASGGTGLLAADAEGQRRVVLVEGVDDVRNVVVKPISAWLPPIPAVRGITQLGDGGLAPVLDLDQLLQAMARRHLDLGALTLTDIAPITRVVVADDSLSVRRALEQLMQDAGFEVATARDGFEALAAVQAKPTHALLVDLEMPRMNGLEVTRSLRNHEETRELPVVMITSRATDRHQAMAAEAGVTRMLGKPFSEDSLVALVRELVAG
jgi:chemosensory pili system protein ChpA (sensor histidine kinase/response regulator)